MAGKTVPLEDAVRFGWETFKSNALFLIGLFAAVAVITSVLQAASGYDAIESTFYSDVLSVIGFLVSMALALGVIAIMIKFKDGENPEFADLFSQISLVLRFTGGMILYFLMVALGTVFFIVPGVYLAIKFHFFGYFIADEGLGPIEALKRSAELTEGVKMDLFLLGVVLFAINLLGALCFVVGLFVTKPISALAMAYVFRYLQGTPPEAQTGVGVQAAYDPYVIYPLPYSLALKWFLSGFVISIVLGIVASLVYKRE